jgi:hypothetical protein
MHPLTGRNRRRYPFGAFWSVAPAILIVLMTIASWATTLVLVRNVAEAMEAQMIAAASSYDPPSAHDLR